MQRDYGEARILRRRKRHGLHECKDARQHTCRDATSRLHSFYDLRMRNTPKPPTPTWKAYVLQSRASARLSQQALADALGVNKSTVWRWENEDRRPESIELAIRVADVTKTPRSIAVAASGLALAGDEEDADPRLVGLDPNHPVVRKIMALDVSEEMRGYMLDRQRQIEELRRQQDLAELEIIANRQRGAA